MTAADPVGPYMPRRPGSKGHGLFAKKCRQAGTAQTLRVRWRAPRLTLGFTAQQPGPARDAARGLGWARVPVSGPGARIASAGAGVGREPWSSTPRRAR